VERCVCVCVCVCACQLEPTTAADVRPQWPPLQQCEECYAADFRNATDVQLHRERWRPEQWQPAMVFVYMQVSYVCRLQGEGDVP
jgi:hypothetical protein